MELDELKTAWQEYNVKLQSTKALSDRLIISMIKERSHSRLSKVKRNYIIGFFYMSGWLIFGAAVLAGNPFDYKQSIEYLPVVIYCICLLVLILMMLRTYKAFEKVEFNVDSINKALKIIIDIYEKPNRFSEWTLRLLLFSATVLFPLSFLPRKVVRMGVFGGIAETLLAMAISAGILFTAYKLGAFKERQSAKFKEDLKELNELKSLSEELNN